VVVVVVGSCINGENAGGRGKGNEIKPPLEKLSSIEEDDDEGKEVDADEEDDDAEDNDNKQEGAEGG